MQTEGDHQIFISSAAEDQKKARDIARMLSQAGMKTWMAAIDLVPGRSWEKETKLALDRSELALIIIGRQGVSGQQSSEVKAALKRSVQDQRFKIVPLLLTGGQIAKLPTALQAYQVVDFRDVEEGGKRLIRLVSALSEDPDTGEIGEDETVGDRLHESGDSSGALPYYQKALSIATARFGDTHPNIAKLQRKLARAFFEKGDMLAAERYFSSALTIDEMSYGASHEMVADDLSSLGRIYALRGELDRAQETLARAMEIVKQTQGNESPEFAASLSNLASVSVIRGDREHAKQLLEEALRITIAIEGNRHPDVAVRLLNLAGVLYDMGDFEEAKKNLETALDITREVYGDDHPKVAGCLNNLGGVYLIIGDLRRAEDCLLGALRISESNMMQLDLAVTLANLANLRHMQGDTEAAVNLARRALSLFEQTVGLDHPWTKQTRAHLALLEKPA